jgi:hypothetical protein
MSASVRAALIGMLGPAVSTLGIIWVLVNVVVDTGRELTLRYVLFDPGHLIIAVGIGISVICLPVALQVAAAEESELELTLPEPERRPAAARQPDTRREVPDSGWEAAEW